MNQSNSLSRPRHARARYIACVGMLTAVCYVVTLVCQLIPPVQGILSFDLKDAVAVIGAFIFGPIAGLALALLPSLLEFLTYSGTGPVGLLMNVLSTAAFVLPAAILYKRSKTRRTAVIGLLISIVFMTVVMLLWNYIVTPGYMEVPRDVVVSMLIPLFLPFNLAKGAANTILALILYKPVVSALRRAGLAPQ